MELLSGGGESSAHFFLRKKNYDSRAQETYGWVFYESDKANFGPSIMFSWLLFPYCISTQLTRTGVSWRIFIGDPLYLVGRKPTFGRKSGRGIKLSDRYLHLHHYFAVVQPKEVTDRLGQIGWELNQYKQGDAFLFLPWLVVLIEECGWQMLISSQFLLA